MFSVEDITKNITEKERRYLDTHGSIQRKLSATLARAGFAAIPIPLFLTKELDLKDSDFFLVSFIISKQWDKEPPYFSIKKLSKFTKMSEKTIRNSRKRLIEKGYLYSPSKGGNRKGRSIYIYDLSGLFKVLEELTKQGKHIQLQYSKETQATTRNMEALLKMKSDLASAKTVTHRKGETVTIADTHR